MFTAHKLLVLLFLALIVIVLISSPCKSGVLEKFNSREAMDAALEAENARVVGIAERFGSVKNLNNGSDGTYGCSDL